MKSDPAVSSLSAFICAEQQQFVGGTAVNDGPTPSALWEAKDSKFNSGH